MAAVGTGRRVLLKMSDGLAQRLNSASRGSRFKRVAIAGGIGGFHFQQVSVFGNGQLRHWPVHVFFYFFEQTGDGQLWLIPIGGVGLAIAGDELKSHPPEDIVRNREGVADFCVLGKARRLETLMSELP